MRAPRILVVAVSALAMTLGWAHWPSNALPEGVVADSVVVRKADRALDLYSDHELLRSYSVSLGSEPMGTKEVEGDGRTPEGSYVIDHRNEASAYCLSLHISYPSSTDRARAEQHRGNAGGLIMIHGLPNGLGFVGRLHLLLDWTQGCVAVTNPEIREIGRVVRNGTPILLKS
jgi:murein L,D-transpeptidase YafK